MDKETLKEIENVIEHSNNGNWMPFGIVCACLFLIVTLFIYILKIKDKANQKDHENTDNILAKLVENNTAMNTMIAVHEIEINNLKNSC